MTRISRRGLLASGAAAGVLAATGMPLRAQQKGGTLRLGLNGANTSDSWDSRTHSDAFMINLGHGAVFDTLTEVAASGELVGELAESWEASADAKVWTFNLRQGVTFHNGKAFGADDVIASLNMHVAEGAKSAAKPIVEPIVEMKKLGEHQVQLTLKAGNADFPFLLSDYHLCMFPAGQIEEAIAKGIGTGMYKVEAFDPGVRALLSRVDSHYKDGRAGWFDSVEVIAINDTSARMNALMTGQVDAVNRVDFKTEALLKANPMINIFEVTGNQHFTFPMLTNLSPFDNVKVRQALKHSVNRQEMVNKILLGHGAVANDIPIGPANQYFASDLEMNDYDPDKAKHLIKEAGLDGLQVDLSASNAAFNGAVDAALLYQSSAKAAGIDINVVQEPEDGYWSNVWLKKAWCACYWSGRATEDWMFSTAYESGVPWNDTQWENARFQELLISARAELDSTKRRDQYHEMQMIMAKEGGTVIPMYANYVDAHSTKLTNSGVIGNAFQMDSSRLIERWWFA
ncbi:Periplasmic dipeptide transport protein precursor [Pelagimonas phthalicica]|uniref:Periplasmic dipeptide transport protein n=1 Tax=Pelagimonas phthalicica TaxID=1037362 RepID=A0A238J761_9RHOB|nr:MULTISPECIES: ABC transporter substrate-binding protein [Roseobacteraceae]MBO9463784.1 ABC transporter substrate-binding protein [Tropicibacter sp. R15_0]TDS95261.1 peptide/nickel transport system substrate-binding protein [Pelagimonas phthalicica]SMX26215.1 Periplasmic dipeptide transport protein precursor [Pelagimonas phthalicica]